MVKHFRKSFERNIVVENGESVSRKTNNCLGHFILRLREVEKLANSPDLGSGVARLVGSSPTLPTKYYESNCDS